MNIQIEEFTDIGDKLVNEDSQGYFIYEDKFIIVVADGVGSHGGGDIASSIAVEYIKKNISENVDKLNEDYLKDIINETNIKIIDNQSSNTKMKTTVCIVVYDGKNIYFAHVGDTRIYYFKNNKIVYQSRDHSVARLQYDIGEISYDDIRGHIDRNRLTKALGGSEDDISSIIKKYDSLEKGDAILVCTDGFWECVVENEMIDTLNSTDDAKKWIEDMVSIVKGHKSTNKDNNTATVLRVV